MGHRIIGVFGAVLLAGCGARRGPVDASASPTPTPAPATSPSDYPTLIVDREHQVEATNKPSNYEITACAGVRLDATKFQFTYGKDAVTPNMVQLVLDKSHVYKLSSPALTKVCVMDRTTLEELVGGPFPGFRSGDRAVLAIGRAMTETSGEEAMSVSWVGSIKVK